MIILTVPSDGPALPVTMAATVVGTWVVLPVAAVDAVLNVIVWLAGRLTVQAYALFVADHCPRFSLT